MNSSISITPAAAANELKKQLLHDFEALALELPPNTLDELIDELGGPNHVAEVSIFYNMEYHM